MSPDMINYLLAERGVQHCPQLRTVVLYYRAKKTEHVVTYNSMNEAQNHNIKRKKPEAKEHLLLDASIDRVQNLSNV